MRYNAEQLMTALSRLLNDTEFIDATNSAQYGSCFTLQAALEAVLGYNSGDMDDARVVDPVTLKVYDKLKNDPLRTQAHDYEPGTFVKSSEGAVYHVTPSWNGRQHFIRLRHPDGSVDSTCMNKDYALADAELHAGLRG